MITSGSLENYQRSIYSVDLTVKTPESGFEYSLVETGVKGGAAKSANLVSISGVNGYLFDQSGNFFGGYESGVPFNIKIYYNYDPPTFSYYHEGVLMANGLDVTGYDVFETGNVNVIMFHKHGDSSATTVASGVKES